MPDHYLDQAIFNILTQIGPIVIFNSKLICLMLFKNIKILITSDLIYLACPNCHTYFTGECGRPWKVRDQRHVFSEGNTHLARVR